MKPEETVIIVYVCLVIIAITVGFLLPSKGNGRYWPKNTDDELKN